MSKEQYKEAVDVMAESFGYMLGEASKSSTQIYNGIITNITNNAYNVQINGRDYIIPQYGNFSHNLNNVVKVFVPQGNMNLAFFI